MFRLAICQMLVQSGRKKENLDRALDQIATAKDHGAHVVLLPEAMDLGWCTPASVETAGVIPEGETCQVLASAAKEHDLWICSGLVEHSCGQIYNSAVLINSTGQVVLQHRKINELEIAHSVYGLGDRLNVCPSPFGTIGLMICADAFARDLIISRALGLMGAEIILSPAAWAVPPDHDNARDPYGALWVNSYAPVCREFKVWIAGCSNVGWCGHGAWKGWKFIGNSIVVDPKGQVVFTGPHGENAEKVLYLDVEIDPRPKRLRPE